MEENTRVFRSRLNTLPTELKAAIAEIPLQIGMRSMSRRKKCIELFNDYKVPFLEIGTGTNRFIVKYDGYALKIALDKEGIADNKQEWVMSETLAPGVSQAYEINKGGQFLVAEYAPAFTSYAEMYSHKSQIKKLLDGWGKRFLLGDVGLSQKNYANWGLLNGKPVCIDYAYIFPANMDLFKCICGSNKVEFTDTTYTMYKCTKCNKQYDDASLRQKISQQTRFTLFQNIKGFEMKEQYETKEIDPRYIVKEVNPDVMNDEDIALSLTRLEMLD